MEMHHACVITIGMTLTSLRCWEKERKKENLVIIHQCQYRVDKFTYLFYKKKTNAGVDIELHFLFTYLPFLLLVSTTATADKAR